MSNPKVGFSVQSFTLAAGVQVEVNWFGNFVRVLSATGAVHVGIDDGNRSEMDAGTFYKLPPGQEFERVTMENRGGVSITVELGLALGEFGDNRLNLASSGLALAGSETLRSSADVSLLAGATTQIVAADADRRELLVSNLSANTQTFRIGDAAAGAAEGVEVQPGQTVSLPTAAAVYGYNPGAGAESVGVVEVLN